MKSQPVKNDLEVLYEEPSLLMDVEQVMETETALQSLDRAELDILAVNLAKIEPEAGTITAVVGSDIKTLPHYAEFRPVLSDQFSFSEPPEQQVIQSLKSFTLTNELLLETHGFFTAKDDENTEKPVFYDVSHAYNKLPFVSPGYSVQKHTVQSNGADSDHKSTSASPHYAEFRPVLSDQFSFSEPPEQQVIQSLKSFTLTNELLLETHGFFTAKDDENTEKPVFYDVSHAYNKLPFVSPGYSVQKHTVQSNGADSDHKSTSASHVDGHMDYIFNITGADGSDIDGPNQASPTTGLYSEYTSGIGAFGLESDFNIEIIFSGLGWTQELQDIFVYAAEYMSYLITGDILDIPSEGIDDIRITAELQAIDGQYGTLGAAGVTGYRYGIGDEPFFMPVAGLMRFDTADVDRYMEYGTFDDIVAHEIFHTLGFGILWPYNGQTYGSIESGNYRFTGENAVLAYNSVFPSIAATDLQSWVGVPIETDGGAGTAGGHWDETIFGNEALTGYVNVDNYISIMTVAALEDMGFETIFDAANPTASITQINDFIAALPTTAVPEPAVEQVVMEFGSVRTNQKVVTVELDHEFVNPVVFLNMTTVNGTNIAVPRLMDYGSDYLSLYIDEADYLDGFHAHENVSYLVVEAGSWTLSDGTKFEVGTVNGDSVFGEGWEKISFSSDFDETPAILTQVQTYNDDAFVTTRQVRADEDGFEVTLQEEEANAKSGHADELIGWFAIEQGAGQVDGISFLADSLDKTFNQRWGDVVFEDQFDELPQLLASLSSTAGHDMAVVRTTGLDEDGVRLLVQEDQSANSETFHAYETIDIFAIEGSGQLTGTKTDYLV